jgi:hypothetical protein
MKKQEYERQNLAQSMNQPLTISDLISAGLACVGLFFVFQPSSLARTVGLSTLLAGGATAGISRLTHKQYVDLAYNRIKTTTEASEGQIESLQRTVSDLELQLAHVVDELSENSDLLKRQVSAQLQAERGFRSAIERLTKEKEQALEALATTTATATANATELQNQNAKLVESQQLLLTSLKLTVAESLEAWSKKLQSLVATAKSKNVSLEPKFDKIAQEEKEKREWYEAELGNIDLDGGAGIGEVADELISLMHSVYDHYGLLRVQIVNSLHVRGKQELIASVASLTEQIQALTRQVEELEAQDVVPREKLEELIQNYKARLQEFQATYGEHAESTIQVAQALEQEVLGQDPIFERMQGLMEQQISQIQTLENKLRQAEQIKLFESASPWRDIANQVIMHFASHEIVCDASTMPIHEAATDIEFFVVPRTRIGMKLIQSDIEKAAESLRIPLGVKSVKISIEGRNIKVKIPIRDKQNVEKERPEDVLNRSRDLWGMYVGSEYHLFIFAATQSGKSTLADELNALTHTRLNGRVEFHAITLKMDGNRDQEMKGRIFIKPRFMRSREDYMEAVCSIHGEIESRNLLLQVNPDKRFNREVFIWDEFGEFYRNSNSELKKAGKEALISILQSGAGLSSETGMGFSVMLFAQNPYVSTFGLLRPDLANGCIIVVGEKNIRLFLESDSDNHGLSKKDLSRLEDELEIFSDASRIASDKAMLEASLNNKDTSIAIRKCPENYFSLIVPSKAGLKPIILYNPALGQYTNAVTSQQDTQPQQVVKPTCPDCASTDARKRGKQGNRYECLNKACSRQTFTWKGLSGS